MGPIPRDINPHVGLVDPELASLPRLHRTESGWLARQRPTPLVLEPDGGGPIG
jgi:hypothetical protein